MVEKIIESDGVTTLVKDGRNFRLDTQGGGAGPLLKRNGQLISDGLGNWVPVAAEASGSGYLVLWRIGETLRLCRTDATGNFTGQLFLPKGPDLWDAETLFKRDLDGDGVAGAPAATRIGATALSRVGDYFRLDTASGEPHFLKVGQRYLSTASWPPKGWTLYGAQASDGVYKAVLVNSATRQFLVQSFDAAGGYVAGVASGNLSDRSIYAYETLLGVDLNGDGATGNPAAPRIIESDGATKLVGVGGAYALYDKASNQGPTLKHDGAVVAGSLDGWTPVAAEAATGGYWVLWQKGAEFRVSTTDANGNFSGAPSLPTGPDLWPYEAAFGRDLDGDGVAGVPAAQIIENAGGVALVRLGNFYRIDTRDTQGNVTSSAYVKWSWGEWLDASVDGALVGVEGADGDYRVALRSTNGLEIIVANSDGELTWSEWAGDISDPAVRQYETFFKQDFDGDGVIGDPTRVIEADGNTKLVGVGETYGLYDKASNQGPTLKHDGAVVAGSLDGWTPVAAEAATGGYFLLWQKGAEFSVSATDANGNFSGAPSLPTGPDLWPYETAFGRDLDGDGVAGVPAATRIGDTALLRVGNYFRLDTADGSGNSGYLKSNGDYLRSDLLAAAGWEVIGAKLDGGVYKLVEINAGTNSFWGISVDAAGNLSWDDDVVGNVWDREVWPFETLFGRDLGGDGFIGTPPPDIRTHDATLAANQRIKASTLFETYDYAGLPIAEYRLSADGGHFYLGDTQLEGTATIDASQLDNLYYVAGPTGGTFKFSVQAKDSATGWSNLVSGAITTTAAVDPFDWLADKGIHDDVSRMLDDRTLSYGEMLTVLQHAAVGGMTGDEFSSLQALVAHFNDGGARSISASSYVQWISEALVDGKSSGRYDGVGMNDWWTGGVKSIDPDSWALLGNLDSSSVEDKVDKLIGKWFLGTDRPALVSSGGSGWTSYGDYGISGVSSFLGQTGTPSLTDPWQGQIGDCFLIASLSEVALKEPELIKSMVVDNGDGTYGVRFFNQWRDTGAYGREEWVTIDNALPIENGSLIYERGSAALWPALIEKAYVQWIDHASGGGGWNFYGDLDYGGWPDTLSEITGKTLNYIDYANNDALADMARQFDSGQEAVVGASWSVGDIVGSHMYSVVNIDASQGLFTLRNPWGTEGTQVESVAQLQAAGCLVACTNGTSRV